MTTTLRTDYAVFNERNVMVKTFDNVESAKDYALHRQAILGKLTVAELTTTRKDLT